MQRLKSMSLDAVISAEQVRFKQSSKSSKSYVVVVVVVLMVVVVVLVVIVVLVVVVVAVAVVVVVDMVNVIDISHGNVAEIVIYFLVKKTDYRSHNYASPLKQDNVDLKTT
jgi:hypothetical protein